ncbi:MAG: EF-P beta-lysylation protein EpmB [Gammaproteobacteria bacterium]
MNSSCRNDAARIESAEHHRADWQRELAHAITGVDELLETLGLDKSPAAELVSRTLSNDGFPLRVPRGYVARMRHGDPDDPLLRQVLPLATEADVLPGFVADPVGDLASSRARGLLQKYHGRALLMTTGACAVHCRFCFRRNFPYREETATPRHLDAAFASIAADSSITEIILSGGDPLSLTDSRLAELFERAGRIGHLRRIRIHSRQPIVLPERVDEGLISTLRNSPLPVVFVSHCNHPDEIDASVHAALSRVRKATSMLFNQAVLLRGVNDSAVVLATLCERLFDAGVTPYYLHQLDAVAGAAHFSIPDAEARNLVAELAAVVPGYLLPRLVRELPGEAAKRAL